MTLEEIKMAVDAGRVVCWANDGYKVIKDKHGKHFICHHSGNCIGLTWLDGVTLNGKEHEFYVK